MYFLIFRTATENHREPASFLVGNGASRVDIKERTLSAGQYAGTASDKWAGKECASSRYTESLSLTNGWPMQIW